LTIKCRTSISKIRVSPTIHFLYRYGATRVRLDTLECALAPSQQSNKHCSNPAWLTVQSTCNYKTYTTAFAGKSGVGKPSCGSYITHDVWFQTAIPNSGIVLYSSDAVSYQWFIDDIAEFGETEKSIDLEVSGSYHVEVVDSNGCTRVSYLVVIDLLSSEDVLGSIVRVFPNPMSDYLHIRPEEGMSNARWTIMSLDGKLQLEGDLGADGTKSISVKGLAPGLYLFRIIHDGSIDTVKLVKD